MSFKRALASIGLVVGTAFTLTTAPAQAAKLTPAQLGLPVLSNQAPVGNGLSSPKASFPYYTSTFSPSQSLRVRFSILTPEGLGSRGMGMSSFGYTVIGSDGKATFQSIFSETRPYDPNASAKGNDWLGSCGKAITGACEVTITFEANKTYQLSLLSKGISTYGVGVLNSYTFDTASDQFYKNGTVAGHKQPFTTVSQPGALFIGMEDGEYKKSGNNFYYDYQDWVVKAEAVPEPATLLGLGAVAGGMLVARRRKAAPSV